MVISRVIYIAIDKHSRIATYSYTGYVYNLQYLTDKTDNNIFKKAIDI